MTLRHPDTAKLDILYTLFDAPELCLAAVNRAARTRDWVNAAGIHPIDGRVLWTIEDDSVALWYRPDAEEVLSP